MTYPPQPPPDPQPISAQPASPGYGPYPHPPVISGPPHGQPTVGAIYAAPQPPPADTSKKFLNMSGGVLALVIAGVVLLCCVGPIALCAFGGVVDALQPKPTVEITKCDVKDGGFLRNADIEYTITNNSGTSRSFRVDFAVVDSSGTKVGDGSDYITDVGGKQTARGSTMVVLDASGGTKCEVSGVN